MRKMEFNENRTFGVEIEFLGSSLNISRAKIAETIRNFGVSAYDESYNHNTKSHWKVITDASCDYEVVSPILKGTDGLNQVKLVCQALNSLGVKINKSCGLHVHHGINDYKLENFKNLFKLYTKYEKCIDKIVPASRRGNTNQYCKTMRVASSFTENSSNGFNYRERREVNDLFKLIDNCKTVDEINSLYGTRYVKLNIQSYVKHGTIEFRHFGGTTDSEKINNWILLTQAMVERGFSKTISRNVNGIERPESIHELTYFLGDGRAETRTEMMHKMVKYFKKREVKFAPELMNA